MGSALGRARRAIGTVLTEESRRPLTWLVSGASRGFGAAIVDAAVRAGDRVVAGVRSPGTGGDDRREQVATVRLDVTDPATVGAAVATAVERFGSLDVVVANAGHHMRGAIEEITDGETREVFEVNVFGTLALLRASLPVLRAQRSGHLVAIGSMSGIVGTPGAGIYNATKFAVAGLVEALAAEVHEFGITATVVEPGGLRTDFLDGSSMRSAEPIADYDATAAGLRHREWARDANHRQPGDPLRAAEVVVEAIRGGRPPVHLLLGADAVAAWEQQKRPRMQADVDAWRDRSVDIAFGSEP